MQDDDQQTEPPPSAIFSDTVNQWVIYDAYVDYEYQKELQDELDRKSKTTDQKITRKRLLGDTVVDENEEISEKIIKAAKVLERMVNQNIFIDIAQGKQQQLYTYTRYADEYHVLVLETKLFFTLLVNFRFQILGGCLG